MREEHRGRELAKRTSPWDVYSLQDAYMLFKTVHSKKAALKLKSNQLKNAVSSVRSVFYAT